MCFLSGLAALLWVNATRAEPSLDEDERRLALQVARVSANEGALWNLRDTALVWQAVEHRGRNTQARLKWLAKHSRRVHGLADCKAGNCRWSRNLRRDLTLPAGLAAGEGYWRKELAPRWLEVLTLAEQLVSGEVHDRPCPTPPDTWGGPLDVENAIAHGLVPVGCEGTLNEGWARIHVETLPGGFTP